MPTGFEPRLVIDGLKEFRVEILEYFSSPIGSVRRVH
jgi:hypothetical protein